MSRSWPTPEETLTEQTVQQPGVGINAQDNDQPQSATALDAAEPVSIEPFVVRHWEKSPSLRDWLNWPSLVRNWHWVVFPALMTLTVGMIVSLLWPPPQAEIILRPLPPNALIPSAVPTWDAQDSLGSSFSELEAEQASDNEPVNATALKSRVKAKALGHHTAKKSAHPPITHLNTATAAQLQRLPGIGPKMAQRVLDYRKTHGPFSSLEQIMDVKGIGPKKFEKLKPFLKI